MDLYGAVGPFIYNQERTIERKVKEGTQTLDITKCSQSGRFLYENGIITFGKFDDPFGPSEIEGTLDETTLAFEKSYKDGTDRVQYTFKKQGDLWVGEWRAKRYAGTAQLFVVPLQQGGAGMHSFHLDVRDR